ncbi:MAG TPA: precorrin-6A synthase (deacetylating) [Solirubrobacteraceae bacterium]|jgi:precorrin-6A synthase|nr:precorrin-6A synthase (deacetylating) [Solirubrobacteraceae bacterium]
MRRLLVIGIGAGDPEHVTVQAVRALNEVDVFFVVEKGHETDELVRLRREICERYIEEPSYRIVEIADPPRDRAAGAARGGPEDDGAAAASERAGAYREAVEDWRARRAEAWGRALAAELGEGECGAFLVWGDPSLYDSTLAVLERIRAAGEVAFEHEVIAGIGSVQALTARHGVPLNRVGRPVQITTGRLLAEGFPEGVDEVVVMLDADCSFRRLPDEGLEIHWGAYVGMPDEILISGPVREVGERIARERAQARERKGWVMDAYLLRRGS